jgi:hypothetical protein
MNLGNRRWDKLIVSSMKLNGGSAALINRGFSSQFHEIMPMIYKVSDKTFYYYRLWES